MIWGLIFFISVILVLYGGTQLTRSGDMIADKTGIGRAWIGLVIISFATTLPELTTSLSALFLVGEPDLAAGNCFGSMAFNLLIVIFIDLFGREKSFRREINRGLLLSGGLSIVLLSAIQCSMLIRRFFPTANVSVWNTDFTSFLIVITYLLTTRLIFNFEKKSVSSKEMGVISRYKEDTLGKSFLLYGVSSLFVLAGGMLLAESSNHIAIITGIGQTFVGSTLVGIVTSLPEVVVGFSAVRLGAPEMVLGNVLGANLFNLIILALCDFVYRRGVLLASLDFTHSITILTAIMMTITLLVSQRYYPEKRIGRLSWGSISLITLYAIGITSLYLLQR